MPFRTRMLLGGSYSAMRKAFICVLVAELCSASCIHAGAQASPLAQHYDSAMRLRQAGRLDEAAQEFRLFLAVTLGELALGRAFEEKNYAKAAPLFEEALVLEPDSQPLRTEYAQAALDAGDLALAETLARQLMNSNDASPANLALAHRILGRALMKQDRDQDARSEMEEAFRLDPSFANAYGLAAVCLDVDDGACAGRVFDEIVQSAGDTPAVHMQIGLAYGNSDFVPQAIAEFRKVIAENPRFPAAHYCLAAALLAAGDDAKNLPEAEAELKKELAISPRDYLTYAALGKLAVSAQRYGEAEVYLKRAASLDSANPDAFLYLGQLYFNTNRLDEAEPALRKAIALTKDPSRNRFQIQKAHYLLGRILMQEHRAGEAHAEMEIAKSFANQGLSHDKSELAGMLGNSTATGSLSAASNSENPDVTARQESSQQDSKSIDEAEKRAAQPIADSYSNLGTIAAIDKNYDEATADFEQAAKWNPKIDGLDLNWGRAAFMASKFAEAVAPLSRYIAAHPEDSGVRTALAMSQFMTADYAGCLQTEKAGAGIMPSIPQAEYVVAESLVKTGEIAQGRSRLEQLETAHPEIEDVHRSLGEVYEAQGDLPKAARELRTAIVLNGADAEAHYDLGKVLVESGNGPEAIQELENAVKLTPDNPAFHRELAAAYRLASRKDDEIRELDLYDRLKNPPAGADMSSPRGVTIVGR
jgi:tetratricopeptide (TPR) repeat protein